MRLRTLGGLAIEGVDFARPKPLLLLTYLAVEGPQDRRYLAELFWPAARDHMKSLTVALTQIRHGVPGSIDADGSRVSATVACDLAEMVALLEQGENAAALDLYRGPFLDGHYVRTIGVELEEWVYGTREYVATRVLRAGLELAEAEAARGRYGDAGRSAQRILERSSVMPEPDDLPRIHTLLLAAGSGEEERVRAEAEPFGLPLAGSRDEARARLRERSEATAPAVGTNLPSRGTSFVGRDLELAETASLLLRPDCRLLTLVGPAGVGKSRLALQVAREQHGQGAFDGGVFLVPLDAVHAADSIPDAIAAALALEVSGPADPLAQVIERIGERRVLLVCDSIEHLQDGAGSLAELLAGCPQLTLLATSRERLNLEEERIFPVGGLAYPDDDGVDPSEARSFDAVRLFTRRAKRARPGFEIADENMTDVLRICRLVEGVPLALELAAVWTRALRVREIADEIERGLDILTSPMRNVLERHRSVRAAFDHSWRLLSTAERRAVRRLAVFHGGFRREAAAEVAGATIPTLASLVDKSLLRIDDSGRYDRHPLLHQYTREKLEERPDEHAEARARHTAHVLRLLRSARELLEAGEARAAFDAIDEELENVHASLRTFDPRRENASGDAVRPGESVEAFRLGIAALVQFFEARGRVRDGMALLRDVRQGPPASSPERRAVQAISLAAEAQLLRGVGEFGAAETLAGEALAAARADGDAATGRKALQVLGLTALHRGAYAQARRAFEEALASVDGDPGELGVAHANLGLAQQLGGDVDDAKRSMAEALSAFRAAGDTLRETRLRNNLGLLHFDAGELERAREQWEEGARLAREVESTRDVLSLTSNLGMLHGARGDYDTARRFDERARALAASTGQSVIEAAAIARQAWIDIELGELARAESGFRQAIALASRSQETPRLLEFVKGLAQVRVAQADTVRAVELFALVSHHPATTPKVREQATTWLSDLDDALPREVEAGARERGRAMSIEEVIDDEVLAAERQRQGA